MMMNKISFKLKKEIHQPTFIVKVSQITDHSTNTFLFNNSAYLCNFRKLFSLDYLRIE